MNSDIRKIDLNLLLTLSVLLEEKNVSRAAARLSLTQPAVSGMLNRLRDIFDDQLFVRTQHGMIPTPRAEALSPSLGTLIADARKLISNEEFNPANTELDFKFSANDYLQSTVLVPFAKELRRQAPHSRLALFNFEPRQLERQLARGELDLAITIPAFVDATLRTQHLYREEYVCVVRKRHPVKASRISMTQFLNFDHAIVSLSGGHFRGAIDDTLAKLGKERRIAISAPSFHILLEILETDNLIALLPKRFLQGRSNRLRQLKPPQPLDGFDVIAAWHSRSQNDAAHQWLRETILRILIPTT